MLTPTVLPRIEELTDGAKEQGGIVNAGSAMKPELNNGLTTRDGISEFWSELDLDDRRDVAERVAGEQGVTASEAVAAMQGMSVREFLMEHPGYIDLEILYSDGNEIPSLALTSPMQVK